MMSFERERENMISKVRLLSEGIAFNLHTALLFNDSLNATDVLSSFSADSQVLRVKLYTEDKQLFAMYEREGTSAPVPTERQRNEIHQKGFSVGDNYIYMKVPIAIDNNHIAHLRVIISSQSLDMIYQKSVTNSMLFLALLLLASFILYYTVDKFIIGPVDALNQQIRSFMDNKESSRSILPVANDEIGDLVEAYNALFLRLDRREKQVTHTMERLEEEKSFVNEVVESVNHALIVVDHRGQIVHANAASCDMFRCTRGFLSKSNILSLFGKADTFAIEEALFCGEELHQLNIKTTDLFGQHQQLNINSTKLTKANQVLFIIEDITETEAALAQQRLAAGVFENAHDGLMVINAQGLITMINPAVTELLGYQADFLINRSPVEVLEWQQFVSLMPKIVESVNEFGQWQGEIWEKHKNGHLVPMFVKVSKITSKDFAGGDDLVFILSDLSNLKEMERLEYLAHHDSLTGLANRAKLCRVLDENLKLDSANRLALLYIDLDGFKNINDSYGHDAGDEVLKQVSLRLIENVASQDLVARLSGDEFVILLNNAEREQVMRLSSSLVKQIKQPIKYKERCVTVSASIGTHCSIGQKDSLDEVLKAADTAMYKAKNSGKGRFVMCDEPS